MFVEDHEVFCIVSKFPEPIYEGSKLTFILGSGHYLGTNPNILTDSFFKALLAFNIDMLFVHPKLVSTSEHIIFGSQNWDNGFACPIENGFEFTIRWPIDSKAFADQYIPSIS